MKMITSFDPTVGINGSFDHKVSNPCGGVYLFNESNVWLQLRLPGGHQVGLPAWWSRFYRLDEVLEPVQWTELATIPSLSSPLSQVYGEAYESSELKNRSFYDGPIPRNPYIGNTVSSSVSTNQVVNDGNPIVSTVVEATQTGNTGGSNLFAGNDGSFYFAQWVAGVYNKYFQGIPGANPVIELGAKLIIQALDNSGANLSNVFGVDASGNTFIQNHKTGAHTVIYSSTGVNIGNIAEQVNGGTLTMNKFALTGTAADVALLQGSISRISKFTGTSTGGGKVTVAHGLGAIPDLVFITFNVSSAPAAATIAPNYATLDATNVDVWASLGAPFVGMAIRF